MWIALIGAALAVAPGKLAGTWTYAGGAAEEQQRDAMVDRTAATFNFALRGFARSKLRKVAVLDQRLIISGDESSLRFVFQGENNRETVGPSDGSPFEVRGAKVRFELVPDSSIVVTGETGDGGKRSTYTLTSADTLRVDYKVWSGMLSAPMTWSLTYQRR